MQIVAASSANVIDGYKFKSDIPLSVVSDNYDVMFTIPDVKGSIVTSEVYPSPHQFNKISTHIENIIDIYNLHIYELENSSEADMQLFQKIKNWVQSKYTYLTYWYAESTINFNEFVIEYLHFLGINNFSNIIIAIDADKLITITYSYRFQTFYLCEGIDINEFMSMTSQFSNDFQYNYITDSNTYEFIPNDNYLCYHKSERALLDLNPLIDGVPQYKQIIVSNYTIIEKDADEYYGASIEIDITFQIMPEV
jgi:hypothetical protein